MCSEYPLLQTHTLARLSAGSTCADASPSASPATLQSGAFLATSEMVLFQMMVQVGWGSLQMSDPPFNAI